jgi:hypothetical protein
MESAWELFLGSKGVPMKKMFRLSGIVLLLGMLMACAAINPQVRMEPGDEACILFGYIDMTGSGDTLQEVTLTQDERSGIAYRQSSMQTYNDGLFFMQDLPPMRYVLPFFYAGGKLYSLRPDEEDAFVLEPGSFAYVGAYKYHDPKKGGIFTAEKFDLVETDSPSEAEILKMLRERVVGDKWKGVIDARLKELGK